MNSIDDDLAERKAMLDQLRPASADALAVLARWYDVELTYSSNAIEGNTLTRSETAIVLEKGITIGGKPLVDHMEALGHQDALAYVRTLARTVEPVREMDVRQIHALVMGRVDPTGAGRYATVPRMISGSSLVLPSPAEIGPLMGEFGQDQAISTPCAELAFSAHERLVTIHPFADGNGRTARLLMNLLLLKAGYPPLVIAPEHRAAYIAGLETFQLHADLKPYRAFMRDRLAASLDHHLEILRGGSQDRASID